MNKITNINDDKLFSQYRTEIVQHFRCLKSPRVLIAEQFHLSSLTLTQNRLCVRQASLRPVTNRHVDHVSTCRTPSSALRSTDQTLLVPLCGLLFQSQMPACPRQALPSLTSLQIVWLPNFLLQTNKFFIQFLRFCIISATKFFVVIRVLGCRVSSQAFGA